MPAEMTDRRFPPLWSIEEHDECFIVRDADGQALGYFYFDEEGNRARPSTGGSRATMRGAWR